MADIYREPTADERAGMDWWNSLSEPRRAAWLYMAQSAKPSDVWAEFKRRAQIEPSDDRAVEPYGRRLSRADKAVANVLKPRKHRP